MQEVRRSIQEVRSYSNEKTDFKLYNIWNK